MNRLMVNLLNESEGTAQSVETSLFNFFERSRKEKVNPEIWKGAIESGKRVLAAIALCVHGMSRHNADERLPQ